MKHIIVKGDTARELASRYPDLVVGRKEHPMPTYKHPVAVLIIKAALGFAAGYIAGKLVDKALPNDKVDILVDRLAAPTKEG